MADANVSVNFSASTSDLLSGIANARDALASLGGPISQLNSQYAAMGSGLAAAQSQAAAALKSGDDASYADAMRAAREAVDGEIKAESDVQKQKLAIYADDARYHRLSEQEKLSDSRTAIDQGYAAELNLLQQKLALSDQSLAQQQRVDNQIAQLEREHQTQLVKLTQDGVDAHTRQYQKLGDAVTGAFNSQLSRLLSGTENWSTAFKKILEQLLIDFIEWSERTIVQSIAAEAAKTSATTAGVAARTGAEQAGAAASIATQGAAMIRSILGSAAEAFAGVFGFLAPIMGPFAAGPAAAAQATVAGAAGAVASADIGMWSVPGDMLTLVHHNELIMPAAEAGSFRNMLSGNATTSSPNRAVHIHPTTNFHVSAVDSGSVAQWMKSNSGTMMKAIDEAVRHGAHLGARRLGSL